MAAGEAKRIFLWSFWVANLLIDAVYVVLCWATADNLSRASGNLHITSGWKDVGQTAREFISNNIWRAPIAACALGGLMVTLFNVVSCGVLLRRSFVRSAAPGFGYGCMLAATFVLSFLTLLVGLVLEGFRGTVDGELLAGGGAGSAGGAGGAGAGAWSDLANGTFAAAYGFSYLVAALFALFFLVLLVFQGAVTRELGIRDAMRAQARAAEMGALTASGGNSAGAAGGAGSGGVAGMTASPI